MMVTILLRTLLIYLILYAIMRLMGKRQIGELEVTDLVTTLLLSEIASLPITNRELPVSYAVIPMVTLLFLEIAFSVILIRLPRLRALVSAKPTVIIQNGVLDQRALEALRISIEELMSELRQQGIPDISTVNCAILEKNGKLTVLLRAEEQPPTAAQMGICVGEVHLSHIVLTNGTVSTKGLAMIGKDERWLRAQLLQRGLDADTLFCVTANEAGELYAIPKQPPSKTIYKRKKK